MPGAGERNLARVRGHTAASAGSTSTSTAGATKSSIVPQGGSKPPKVALGQSVQEQREKIKKYVGSHGKCILSLPFDSFCLLNFHRIRLI